MALYLSLHHDNLKLFNIKDKRVIVNLSSGSRIRRLCTAIELQQSRDVPIDILQSQLDDIPIIELSTDEENPYTSVDALSFPIEGRGGEPELEALLQENGADLSVERLERIFPFPLDMFQRKAIEKFLQEKSVVVCAPTGAGKTAIAEAAAAATLARGLRVIYTTPLKALSNQKLHDTRKRFGHDRCGLQTGDTSLNTEAQIVIMTTEILRNIMYRTAEIAGQSASTSSTRESRLGDVGLIVLDEVHYLGDPSRGSVWEEIIINCPRHIQLLCMSATVKNPDDLGGWIHKEHQSCATIKTRFRPVPLHWHFAFKGNRGAVMADLFGEDGKILNPRLRSLKETAPRGRRPRGFLLDDEEESEETMRKSMMKLIPSMESVTAALREREYLPAIWFILSRRDCDLNAIRAALVPLVTPAEQKEIEVELNLLKAEAPEAVREKLVDALLRGVSSHHAGHLPGWKLMVERLYQRGLLKLVFATGTLAAGINMPARTTVISALSRRTEVGFEPIGHNELLQMAGRAGRRGFDTEGHCVIVQGRFEGAPEGYEIIKKGPEPLSSQFTVGYGLVLNLLSCYEMKEVRTFISKSFGNYLSGEGNERKMAQVEALERDAERLMEEFKSTASGQVQELNETLKDERQALAELKQAIIADRTTRATTLISSLGLPRTVLLNVAKGDDAKPVLVPAVLVATMPGPQGNAGPVGGYYGLSADNRLLKVELVHVVGVMAGTEKMGPNEVTMVVTAVKEMKAKAWQAMQAGINTLKSAPGDVNTARVAMTVSARSKWTIIEVDSELAKQVLEARARVKTAVTRLEEARRAAAKGAPGSISEGDSQAMESVARAKGLMKKARALRSEMSSVVESKLRSFLGVIDILVEMGGLQRGPTEDSSPQLMLLGLVSRQIKAQNELWLGAALCHQPTARLQPPQLAGLLGALLSAEVSRRPMSIGFAYGASQEVVEVVESLEPIRQHLFSLQLDAGLVAWNEYLAVDLRLAGLVEAWAAGASWTEVCMDSTLDDGDIARLFIRTADMLRQVMYNPYLVPELRDAAAEAARGMDRPPIAEMTM